jgi:DNA (cytosine-5)-methyltransferase 3A
MNVLSLFDGMSCGRIALNRLNTKVDNYFSSEVDKHAIKVANHNHPQDANNRLGDVTHIDGTQLPKIDLLIGGSPCTQFSFSGTRKGMVTKDNVEITTLEHYLEIKDQGFEFQGQSFLFWEYMRILNEVKPRYFLLENVNMSDKWQQVLSDAIGVEPIRINSSLVSAHNRVRLYWTNIPNVTQPDDLGINLIDVIDKDKLDLGINKATILGRRIGIDGKRKDYDKSIPLIQCLEVRESNRNKCNCLTTVAKDNVLTSLPIGRHIDVYGKRLPFRNYTLEEYCRLQTVPTDYFGGVVSDNQCKKMIGNGWTVDVIKYIFSHMEN